MTACVRTRHPLALGLCSILAGSLPGQTPTTAHATPRPPEATQPAHKATALDAYVAKEDATYAWKELSSIQQGPLTAYVLELRSQTWRSKKDLDRPVWKHWLRIIRPEKPASDTALLFITGGTNGGKAPVGPSGMMLQIAMATNCIVAELKMVPNQKLEFGGDGKQRREDDLIAYTWDKFLTTGDPTWPAQLPMTKSAVRAMDAVQDHVAKVSKGGQAVKDFVVAGASKRGWTTWLTAAVDPRVCGIVPIVIDVLGVDASMKHHYAAYGFWSPAVGDYVRHGIMKHMGSEQLDRLYGIVDPLSYRSRLTMPKLILNAAGDQFFLPDSSRFYFDTLPGEKHLRYVPNVGHGLRKSDALQTMTAFFAAVATKKPRPEITWTFGKDGSIHAVPKTRPKEVKLWQAVNTQARDFRQEMADKYDNGYKSTTLAPNEDGSYTAHVIMPAEGWTAYFVELTFDIGLPLPLKLTTAVRVSPDTLPFADKDPSKDARLGPGR